MSRFVRASKVRHVYCQPPKSEDTYSNFRLSTATGDHNYIKANTKFFAIPIAVGGGSLAVHSLEDVGRFPAQPAVLDGHKGSILDFEFNPFHENIIATGGDDCTIKLWGIPNGGLDKSQSEPLVDLQEHQRKISVLRFHPTANHVLASGSADHTVKLWDVENGESILEVPHDELLQDVVWSYDGSLMATTSRDKQLRIIDPRDGTVTTSVEAHNGTKTCKLTFLGSKEKLASVGFTRQSKRQLKIWDPKMMNAPIAVQDIDQAAGVIMPFYDEGSNLLFLGGKGDGNIRFLEIVDDNPWCFPISEFKATTPCRGLCILPTRSVDTHKCEVVRLLKLTSNAVQPLSFICPRKSDLFQADLYPDAYAGVQALSAEEFFDGKVKKPVLVTMDPSKRSGTEKKETAFVTKKNATQLQSEVDKLHLYIDKLVAALDKAKVKVPEP